MADLPREQNASHDPNWDLLARYLAGESDLAERVRVERDLAEHPESAALVSMLGHTWRAPNDEPLAPAQVEAALAAVMARRGTAVTPLRPRWNALSIPMRAAAALLVVAAGVLGWRLIMPGQVSQTARGSAHAVPHTFASGVGVLDSLKLPDGSGVVLGPASSIVLETGYGTSARALSLHGQAMFDVVHDAEHPFVVTAGAAQLRDVGTTFLVESGQRNGETRIVVTDGAVAVRGTDRAAPADTLGAGDRAIVSAAGVVSVERGVAYDDDRAWLDGRLVFRDASVAQVTDDLRRWFGLELRVTDPRLAMHHLTAAFDHDARADVGHIVAAALGARVDQSGDTIWIRPTAGSARR
jgi:transmembrane sensor